jgi:D-sedoheptulose 7-phosphate isomerase
MNDYVEELLRSTAALHEQMCLQSPTIAEAALRIADVLDEGGTLYIAGNGGSAADAQHMAGELVGRFLIQGRAPLPCVALTTDTSVLTAIGNDFGYDAVFARQAQALVQSGDALLGISTSGNSPNVCAALAIARTRGALTVSLTGGKGGAMAESSDLSIVAPGDSSPRIQELHSTIIHIWCDIIERIIEVRKTD